MASIAEQGTFALLPRHSLDRSRKLVAISPERRDQRLNAMLSEANETDGIVRSADAEQHGFDRSAIARLVGAGFLERVGPHHVRARHLPWTLAARHRQAVLRGGPSAALAARSALVVHDLWTTPPRIEIVVPRGVKGTTGPHRRIQSTDLIPSDVAVHRAMALTTPTRSLIDAARDLSVEQTVRVISNGVRRGTLDVAKIGMRLAELAVRGRPGIRTTRQALTYFDDRPLATTFEQDLEAIIDRGGFAVPVRQFRVRCGTHTYYLDHAWPDAGCWSECDSMLAHGSADALQRDLERQNRIIAETGFQPLRFTYWDVHQRPDYVTEVLSKHVPRR